MMPRFYTILIVFALSINGFSQDMEKGFSFLETGKYQQAEVFFEVILEDYPDHRTARLCYGRAVGLHGNTQKAIRLFTDLAKDYPDDFEVKLNYGESLLWNNDFIAAQIYFKKLLQENPKSFPVLLSYANTLSNLKDYENALIFVDKALEILPSNPNALTSKKYMYLGYAYQKQQLQDYSKVEALLKENLRLFPSDKDSLVNLANLYLIISQIEKAKSTYELLAQNSENKSLSLNGLALVAHLNGQEKEALKLSSQAYESLPHKDQVVTKQTNERYVQALIWNKKYKTAKTVITNLASEYPNQNWVLALRATLHTYMGNFKKSLEGYRSILSADSTSFDGNLGKANTLKALGRYNASYAAARNTLSIFNNQKDAVNFVKILDKQFTPFVETKTTYSFDNGDNKAKMFLANLSVPVSTKFTFSGVYSHRDATNSVINNSAEANNMLLGCSYLIRPTINLKTSIGITDVNALQTDYTQFVTAIEFAINSFQLQNLDVGFRRQWQDFNADLLGKEIAQNTIYTNYNLRTNFNLGWYTQYHYTWQNDDNQSHLLFTSLYYNIFDKPLLKAGLNYQYITFKDQVPFTYFSPKRFDAIEVFVDFVKNQKGNWFYDLNMATGMQFVKDQEKQNTYRFQGNFGYKISNRFVANLYGLHSNIASTTSAGFIYSEVGIRLKWDLFKKPIFSTR